MPDDEGLREEIDIEGLLREAGPGICSPEVQTQVDDLLARDAPPISIEFRQRLIAAAERGLRDNRERIVHPRALRQHLTAIVAKRVYGDTAQAEIVDAFMPLVERALAAAEERGRRDAEAADGTEPRPAHQEITRTPEAAARLREDLDKIQAAERAIWTEPRPAHQQDETEAGRG